MRRVHNVALTFALLSLGLGACQSHDEKKSATPIKDEVLSVAPSQIDDIKPVAATLTTRKLSEATARISGLLVSLKVHEGDDVTAGQVIGQVQDKSINQQTGAYVAAAAAAEAQAVNARAALKRTQILFDKGIYAQAKLDQDKAMADAADANVRAARAQGAASAAVGHNGLILAPGSGRVIKADVPQGSAVMAGQSIATITDGPRVVRIELPEAQGHALKIGDTIRLSAGSESALGQIVTIYPSVTAGQMTADVAPQGLDDIKIGERITAFVILGQRQAISLPKRFVTTRYGLDYVRLVQKDHGILETTVQTAPTSDPDQVEILGGLGPGDVVAAFGASK